jgi:hypothetical protein
VRFQDGCWLALVSGQSFQIRESWCLSPNVTMQPKETAKPLTCFEA